MTTAVLRPRLFARLAAAAAATVLVLGGCTSTDPAPDGDGGPDAGPGPSAPQEDGPQLQELGTSAAADLPSDPAEDPAYAAYYE